MAPCADPAAGSIFYAMRAEMLVVRRDLSRMIDLPRSVLRDVGGTAGWTSARQHVSGGRSRGADLGAAD